MSSRNRNGSVTATPQKVSVTGRGAGGGGTSTPPNDAAVASGAARSDQTSGEAASGIFISR